jgi:hypothetical protein
MLATQATDRVLVQAGHSAQFPPYRTGGGGAPGEAAWATDLAAMLAGRLRAAGVEVVLVGAWLVNGVVGPAPALVTDEDYDLFLSLHYDAAIYAENTGCIVARAANDPVGSLADRFIAIWKRRYPAATGIPLHQERVNTNMTDYYAFRDTTAQTPGVILEHGVGALDGGLDHATLFDRIDEVARVDAACVLEYLGITAPEEDEMTAEQRRMLDLLAGWEITTPAALEDWKTWSDQTAKDVDALRREVEGLTDQLGAADLRAGSDLASVAVTRRDGRVEMLQ